MEQEELLMCNIDPLDPEFNEPPSFEGNNTECVNCFVLQQSLFFN